jgi:hypothetical protein
MASIGYGMHIARHAQDPPRIDAMSSKVADPVKSIWKPVAKFDGAGFMKAIKYQTKLDTPKMTALMIMLSHNMMKQ